MFVYLLFRFAVFVFWLTPFWLLYLWSDMLYWILHRMVGYRKKTVRANLRRVFPDKSAEELSALEKRFYRHLCDIVLEGIKGFSMSRKQLLERYTINNTDSVDAYKHQGKSVVAVGSHCANWEWGAICTGAFTAHPVAILYQPIKNPYIDRYVRRSRQKMRTKLYSVQDMRTCIRETSKEPHLLIFLADQSPSNLDMAHWLPFFGQPTAFLHGPAKFALRYNLPIFFIRTRRLSRGRYSVQPLLLEESPREHTSEQLTQRYVRLLQALIEEEPAHWLWSHRRWKHQPPPQDIFPENNSERR